MRNREGRSPTTKEPAFSYPQQPTERIRSKIDQYLHCLINQLYQMIRALLAVSAKKARYIFRAFEKRRIIKESQPIIP